MLRFVAAKDVAVGDMICNPSNRYPGFHWVQVTKVRRDTMTDAEGQIVMSTSQCDTWEPPLEIVAIDRPTSAPSMTKLRRLVGAVDGRVRPDGCGGHEVLAPPNHRWIARKARRLTLSLGKYYLGDEKQAEIQRCIDIVARGIEPSPEDP